MTEGIRKIVLSSNQNIMLTWTLAWASSQQIFHLNDHKLCHPTSGKPIWTIILFTKNIKQDLTLGDEYPNDTIDNGLYHHDISTALQLAIYSQKQNEFLSFQL